MTASQSKIGRRSYGTTKGKLSLADQYVHSSCVENMAHIHQVNKQNKGFEDHVPLACTSLKAQKVIAVPTDTIYGIAALAQSTEAVKRLYDIKCRDTKNPISICVGDVEDVYKWGKVTISKVLLQKLLPGPVTVVFERTHFLNPDLNPGTSLVGIRVPDHGFVREVTRSCGEPLALTSANISSQQSSVTIQEFQHLWPKLDGVFDGGKLGTTERSRLGSTVVDLSKPGVFTLIRNGSAHLKTQETLTQYGLKEEKKGELS